MEAICRYVVENLDADLSAATVAGRAGLSSSTMRKQFAEYYGISFHRFILQQRMEKARQLLIEGTYTVSEVGRMVGYGEVSNFSNAFQKYHRISPRNIITKSNEKHARSDGEQIS